MNVSRDKARARVATVVTISMLLILSSLSVACIVRSNGLERRLERAYDPQEGVFPEFDDGIFSVGSRWTGILRAERFNRVFGFWIFLQEPHDPRLTPVVFLHGHTTGPRQLESVVDALDRSRFEPWLTYYATGIELDRSANLLRQSLAEMALRYEKRRVAVVAYSLGGLVMRQALRPQDDGVQMPEVPLFITVSTPWAGSEHRRFDRRGDFRPGSWTDIADGSRFLDHLFDEPLPAPTKLHVIYGLTDRDRPSVPGYDDRILSERSLTREEALNEAASVTEVSDTNHLDIIEEPGVITLINQLLDEIHPPDSAPHSPESGPRPDVASGGIVDLPRILPRGRREFGEEVPSRGFTPINKSL